MLQTANHKITRSVSSSTKTKVSSTSAGLAMGTTKKFRNVRSHPLVALVVDDIASLTPWRVRGVEIRGRAEAISDWPPPYPYFSKQAIRIHPVKVLSWGLD